MIKKIPTSILYYILSYQKKYFITFYMLINYTNNLPTEKKTIQINALHLAKCRRFIRNILVLITNRSIFFHKEKI